MSYIIVGSDLINEREQNAKEGKTDFHNFGRIISLYIKEVYAYIT